MTRTSFRHWAAGILAAAIVVSCAGTKADSVTPTLTAKETFFVENVKPILQMNCLRCHNGKTLPGKLNLTSKDLAFQPQKGGKAFIVPGKPDESKLVTAVSRKGTHRKMMPQLPVSLTDDQIGVLREWIEDGAAWPAGKPGSLAPTVNPENP